MNEIIFLLVCFMPLGVYIYIQYLIDRPDSKKTGKTHRSIAKRIDNTQVINGHASIHGSIGSG